MTNRTFKECVKTLQKVETLLQLIVVAENGLTGAELKALTKLEQTGLSRILYMMQMRGWLIKHDLPARQATWFISSDFIRAAYIWKRPTNPETKILTRLMTTDLCFERELIGKALRVFNVVLLSGQEGKKLSEFSENPTYQPTTTSYKFRTVHLILRSWEKLGWLTKMQVKGQPDRWKLSSKLVDVARTYQNQCDLKIQQFNVEFAGESL